MGLFGSIGKAIGGVAKTVTKPIAVVAKPLSKTVRNAATAATKGTPLEASVAKMTKLDFGKNPIKAIGGAVVENFKGAATLGKSLVASKITGAVQGAVGNAMKGTPLEGTSAANAVSQEVGAFTSKLTGGSAAAKLAGKATQAAGGPLKADAAIPAGASTFGMNLRAATNPSWDAFASRADTMGGLFGGSV